MRQAGNRNLYNLSLHYVKYYPNYLAAARRIPVSTRSNAYSNYGTTKANSPDMYR